MRSYICCFLEILRSLWDNSSCKATHLEFKMKNKNLKVGIMGLIRGLQHA